MDTERSADAAASAGESDEDLEEPEGLEEIESEEEEEDEDDFEEERPTSSVRVLLLLWCSARGTRILAKCSQTLHAPRSHPYIALHVSHAHSIRRLQRKRKGMGSKTKSPRSTPRSSKKAAKRVVVSGLADLLDDEDTGLFHAMVSDPDGGDAAIDEWIGRWVVDDWIGYGSRIVNRKSSCPPLLPGRA